MTYEVTTKNKYALLEDQSDVSDPIPKDLDKSLNVPKATVEKKKIVAAKLESEPIKKQVLEKENVPPTKRDQTDKLVSFKDDTSDGKRQKDGKSAGERKSDKEEKDVEPQAFDSATDAKETAEAGKEECTNLDDTKEEEKPELPKRTLQEYKDQSKIDEPQFNVRQPISLSTNFVPIKRTDGKDSEDKNAPTEGNAPVRKKREKTIVADFMFANPKRSFGPEQRRRDGAGSRGGRGGGPGRGGPNRDGGTTGERNRAGDDADGSAAPVRGGSYTRGGMGMGRSNNPEVPAAQVPSGNEASDDWS